MKLKMISPDDIMTVVVSLIIFAVGVYAFFVTMQNIPTTTPSSTTSTLSNATYHGVLNASATGTSVFNIVGVVLIIGAIMIIVGIVYSYIRPVGSGPAPPM